LTAGAIEGRRQPRQLLQRRIGAGDGVAVQISDRYDQIVEETPVPGGDGALVALQRDLILILTLPISAGSKGARCFSSSSYNRRGDSG